jgi:diaminopimelate decarboxylase
MIEKLHTPCWIVNSEAIRTQIASLGTALSKHFGEWAIGYSVKTNSLPQLLALVKEQGCKAEVVSADEWELAHLSGFDASEIIYNGPLKSRETFLKTIVSGGIVNIETKRELEWLNDLPKQGKWNVGIRISINLSRISAKDAVRDNDNSRFGISDSTSELSDAINYIRALPNVKLSGLHLHRTTQARRVNYYRHVVKYAASVIKKYDLALDYLDIGGGFYGTLPGKPGYEEYVRAIRETLDEQDIGKIRLIVEPGTAIIDGSVQFLAEVIDVKRNDDNTIFVTTNGSRTDIDPFFRKKSYICQIIATDIEQREQERQQTICGCTCIEEDRITRLIDSPRLILGDKLLFKNVGAYTMTLNPLFIRYFAPVYLHEGNSYTLIRDNWQANDIYTINTERKCTL